MIKFFSLVLRTSRLSHWVKNLLLFCPYFASHSFSYSKTLDLFQGFLGFSLVVSATYIINDFIDLKVDRTHPTKKHRPLAAGSLSELKAWIIMALMLASGTLILIPLGWASVLTTSGYIVLSLSYSLYLKKLLILDVFILSSFYMLRVIIGEEIVDCAYSPWFMGFVGFLLLSFGLAKRAVEIRDVKYGKQSAIQKRSYKVEDLNIILSFGIATLVAAALILMVYVFQDISLKHYSSPIFLSLLPFILLCWGMRLFIYIQRGEVSQDPIEFAVRDKASYAYFFVVAILYLLASYS